MVIFGIFSLFMATMKMIMCLSSNITVCFFYFQISFFLAHLKEKPVIRHIKKLIFNYCFISKTFIFNEILIDIWDTVEKIWKNLFFDNDQIWHKVTFISVLNITRNPTRCNNRNDLLLDFKNVSVFGGLYITQSNIYDAAFIMKMVSR